jgi:hypothetical protein
MVHAYPDQAQATLTCQAATDLEQRFRNSPYWPLRRLNCVGQSDLVIVRGTVPSYYLRQVADSLAANVLGVGHILSEIQVESEQPA